jgi:hypothetical protein
MEHLLKHTLNRKRSKIWPSTKGFITSPSTMCSGGTERDKTKSRRLPIGSLRSIKEKYLSRPSVTTAVDLKRVPCPRLLSVKIRQSGHSHFRRLESETIKHFKSTNRATRAIQALIVIVQSIRTSKSEQSRFRGL